MIAKIISALPSWCRICKKVTGTRRYLGAKVCVECGNAK